MSKSTKIAFIVLGICAAICAVIYFVLGEVNAVSGKVAFPAMLISVGLAAILCASVQNAENNLTFARICLVSGIILVLCSAIILAVRIFTVPA